MLLLAMILGSLAAAEPTPAPDRILVLDIQSDALPADQAGVLRDIIATETARDRRYVAMSSEDLRRTLDLEAQKQAAGCDDQECMAELAAALGARYVVHAGVGRLGQRWVATLSMVATELNQPRPQTIQAASLDGLADALPASVGKLLQRDGTVADGASRPVPVWATGAFVSAALAGVASAGLGGYAWFLSDTLSNPAGDAAVKQQALDVGVPVTVSAAALAGLTVAMVAVGMVGLLAE